MTTAKELLAELQPFMVREYGAHTLNEQVRLDYANQRLLGKPASNGREATGLHKYGRKHLDDEIWPAFRISHEEITDAITQLGPLLDDRIGAGRAKPLGTFEECRRTEILLLLHRALRLIEPLSVLESEEVE